MATHILLIQAILVTALSIMFVVLPSVQAAYQILSQLTVILYLVMYLLMFAAGAEMRRLLQRDAVRTVGLIASLGLVLPFAAGLGLVAALGVHQFIGTAGNHTALTLVFGMAVAVTSIPVISCSVSGPPSR